MKFLCLSLIFILSTTLLVSNVDACCKLKSSLETHNCHDDFGASHQDAGDSENDSTSNKCSTNCCCSLLSLLDNTKQDLLRITESELLPSYYILRKTNSVIYPPYIPPIVS